MGWWNSRRQLRSLSCGLGFYSYEGLDQGQIRLLYIKRWMPFSGPLKVKVVEFKLDEAPPYEAKSYTWGDPTPKHEILMNDSLLVSLAVCMLLCTPEALFGMRDCYGLISSASIRKTRLKNEAKYLWCEIYKPTLLVWSLGLMNLRRLQWRRL